MKTKLTFISTVALLSTLNSQLLAAPVGTAFTYQGKLADGANPANGIYDLRFTLYDALAGGSAVGGPLTNSAAAVTNGTFTATLDFGAGVFGASARWLEIGVRTNGSGAFVTLAPRQPLTPSPYALYAPSAGAAATASSVAAANVTGTLALSQLPAGLITNNGTGVTLAGTFTGSGVGITNVNADLVDGQHGAFYQNAANLTSGALADARLSANVPLLNASQSFTGTNRFQRVGIGSANPGQLLQVGDAAFNGAQGLIRLAARSTNSSENRVWDIGVPQSGSDVSGIGYSFIIDDTQLGTGPEFLVHWGTGRVGIGRTNPVSALDVNGTVTATGFAGNGASLTNLSYSQLNGLVPLSLLPSAVVTNNETGVNLFGAFGGDGAGVTNLNLMTVNSQGALGWTTNWTTNWSGNFVLSSSPTVGPDPVSIAVADVNADGAPDLIAANEAGSTLSVLTNNGSGAFALSATLTVGTSPACVIAADINGDGKVDLISANSDANTLSVLTNNGSGAFILASSPAVGLSPRSVAAADINGDGKLDLISANANANTLSVLTNNGSGGFVTAATITVGTGPYCVLASDVNDDGKPDLVSANIDNNTLSVLTNNGTGAFVLAATIPVTSPREVIGVDINQDGHVDLVTANQSASTLSVLTNNGRGAFVLSTTVAAGPNIRSVISADINSDGSLDLICANIGGNTLSVLTNNGRGGFFLAGTLPSGSAVGLAVADLNRDGGPDLVSGHLFASALSVFFNTPRSLDSAFQANFIGNGAGLTGVDAGLFNGQQADFYLNAANLSSGSLADARLSTNVALLNGNQVFTGSNLFASTCAGNGGGLTNVPGAVPWQTVAGTSQATAPDRGYLLTNSAQVTLTLPAAPALGDVVRVSGAGAGGWKVAQNSGQVILVGSIPGNRGASWTAHGSSLAWSCIACSADGTKLVAGEYSGGGQIYTSADSGVTWTVRTGAGYGAWMCVACSADGTKLVAGRYGGQLFTSIDSGTNWTARATSQNWISVASSADGTKLIAAVEFGQIYTSTDSGATWTARATTQRWHGVASSSDGTRLVACAMNSGQIYTSVDSGVTWTPRLSSGEWADVASSADGSKLIAANHGGQLFTSTDFGVTWAGRTGNQLWWAVASSADGIKLAAVLYNSSPVYTSDDAGVTWTPHGSSRTWSGLACSADGAKLFGVAGQIFTGTSSTTPGASGYLTGSQYSAVELHYIGSGQFMPLSYAGTILAY